MSNAGNPRELLGEVEARLVQWLREESRGTRVDIIMVGIGRVQLRTGTLVVNGIEVPANIPYEVAAVQMNHLRAAQVVPGRGAWTWCRLWMDVSDGVLHQECDWMREPVFSRASGDVRPGPGDCWSELERYPRDDEFIPDWLRRGYEVELKRRERNARRREARRRKREQERERGD